MSTNETDIDYPSAKLAYTIIQSLLQSNESLGDLLAVMAHSLDEDTVKALTNTGEWERYMDARRDLDATKERIDAFIEELKKLGAE